MVTVQLEVREVFAVDLVRGTFRVAFVVTTRWYDRFFDRDEFFNEEEMYAQSKPYITFDHVDEGDGPNGEDHKACPHGDVDDEPPSLNRPFHPCVG